VRDELQRRRDAAVSAIRALGLEVEAPRAAMYLWIPLPDGIPSGAFALRVLEETGVVVFPGSGFGAAGEGYFRIAFTTGAARITEAVERLGGVLAKMRHGAATSV
jgi:LL-diaminopimelate aminotransferase